MLRVVKTYRGLNATHHTMSPHVTNAQVGMTMVIVSRHQSVTLKVLFRRLNPRLRVNLSILLQNMFIGTILSNVQLV